MRPLHFRVQLANDVLIKARSGECQQAANRSLVHFEFTCRPAPASESKSARRRPPRRARVVKTAASANLPPPGAPVCACQSALAQSTASAERQSSAECVPNYPRPHASRWRPGRLRDLQPRAAATPAARQLLTGAVNHQRRCRAPAPGLLLLSALATQTHSRAPEAPPLARSIRLIPSRGSNLAPVAAELGVARAPAKPLRARSSQVQMAANKAKRRRQKRNDLKNSEINLFAAARLSNSNSRAHTAGASCTSLRSRCSRRLLSPLALAARRACKSERECCTLHSHRYVRCHYLFDGPEIGGSSKFMSASLWRARKIYIELNRA